MLLAASESAVTKKPRLRLTMRRSSSVRPLGSFQSAMSRLMFTSCGIQWLAQVARYFSQAHLYLNGTSWLTSVLPLMMRLSATLMRRAPGVPALAEEERGASDSDTGTPGMLVARGRGAGFDEGVTCSSQVNICVSNSADYRSVGMKCKGLMRDGRALCCGVASNARASTPQHIGTDGFTSLAGFTTGVVDGTELDVGGGLHHRRPRL